ncbi:MAG: NAD-dependent epimerase/dehydratase family protein [Candidatus Nitronauta litoralis]|uniref:NAD-dependent epimerase/dehydratase family protein n=1 Tax=Candidatus Nitronauta litoralis TaxID=2705533 RepID=A0A7T0BYR4_9BACT|nr:MAG: NAD-dependent epimerase/dehydratase family protein [Candidatus Nitronauta litoralis]
MRILVTGGGGFLGSHVALRLNELGHDVTVFGRRPYHHLPDDIRQVQGDLNQAEEVAFACKDQEAVFHSGALTGIWGPREVFEKTNILGTQNIIDSCFNSGVKKLIYTSSPSVVFGESDLENVDESVPYPKQYLTSYPQTKAEAERRVIAANGNSGLLTVALRPHLIWGPQDPHLVPRILERAGQKKLIKVGNGKNLVDIIYIDNAVEGHLLALEALQPGATCAGRVYFLSDDEPVVLWDWISRLIKEMELPPISRSISYALAKKLGHGMELWYTLLGKQSEPRMTRFVAGQLAKSHFFNITAAKRDLNYRPVVSPEEGWKKMIRWFKTHPVN